MEFSASNDGSYQLHRRGRYGLKDTMDNRLYGVFERDIVRINGVLHAEVH